MECQGPDSLGNSSNSSSNSNKSCLQISSFEPGGSLSSSAHLAPTDFNISTTTAGSKNSADPVTNHERSASVPPIPMLGCRSCGRHRLIFTCRPCVKAGRFKHSRCSIRNSIQPYHPKSEQYQLSQKKNQDQHKLTCLSATQSPLNKLKSQVFPLTETFEEKKELMLVLEYDHLKLNDKVKTILEEHQHKEIAKAKLLLQEEKVLLLKKAVLEAQASNYNASNARNVYIDLIAQAHLRRRKHEEKVKKIQEFLVKFEAKLIEKKAELDYLNTQVQKLRRQRIGELMQHIFSITEEKPPIQLAPLKLPTDSEPVHPEASSLFKCLGVLGNASHSTKLNNVPSLLEAKKGLISPYPGPPSSFYDLSSRHSWEDDDRPPMELPVDQSGVLHCFENMQNSAPIWDSDMEEDDDDLIVGQLEASLRPDPVKATLVHRSGKCPTDRPMPEPLYRIISPTLPASGDFSKVIPLIVTRQKQSTVVAVPESASGKSPPVQSSTSPKRLADGVRIEQDVMQNAFAGLSHAAQLVSCLSFYLDVILPKRVVPADFMMKPPKVSSFTRSLKRLNTNVLFLCVSQSVPLNVLHPSQMMHNIQMLLNTTVTPQLGSVTHFRVDDLLLESLEESVVIVANNAQDDEADFSSSSSEDEDCGREEATGEWDYIPADMTIPSLPLNEGFPGSESSTLAGGFSSYSISNAAASVASWWRSSK